MKRREPSVRDLELSDGRMVKRHRWAKDVYANKSFRTGGNSPRGIGRGWRL